MDCPGEYNIRVKAKDINERESDWSIPLTVTIVEGPILDIGLISGGLFKVNTVIKNIGGVEATDVNWKITLDGGAFIGKETSGTETITAGEEVRVSSKLIIGLGATTVTVTAEISEGSDTRSQGGKILLFFVIINPSGGI